MAGLKPPSGHQTLCLLEGSLDPSELDAFAARLAEHEIELVVEERTGERRRVGERRGGTVAPPPGSPERRRIGHSDDRRVADRRVPVETLEPDALPPEFWLPPPELAAIRFVVRLDSAPAAYHSPEVELLARRAQAGDAAAAEKLFGTLLPTVYQQCWTATWNPHDAEDLAQITLTKVLDALPGFRFTDAAPFGGWVNFIARNVIIDHVRRANRAVAEPVEPETLESVTWDHDPFAAVQLHALDWISDPRLARELLRVPKRQWQVLSLRYQLGLSTTEIAAALDDTPKAVRRLHERAIAAFRERLGDADETSRRRRSASLRRMSPAPVLAARRFALR